MPEVYDPQNFQRMNEGRFNMIVDVFLNMFIVISVVSTCFFLYIMHITKMLHSNLKFTLMFLSITLRLMTVTRAVADFAYLMDSTAQITYYICESMSFCHLLSMGFVQLSFAALVIERALATIYHANYELWGNKLAKVVIGLFTINAVGFCLTCLLLKSYGIVRAEENFPTCIIVFKCPVFTIYSWAVFGLTMLLGAGPIVWLYYYNKKMCLFRANGSLTTRYQYHDNVVILRIYAPVIVFAVFGIGLVCMVIVLTAGIKLLHHETLSLEMYTLFKCTFVMSDIAATSIETVLIRFHPVLWLNARRCFPCFFKAEKVGEGPKETEIAYGPDFHFNQLTASWK
ncbi:unnamed protein product [Bursaphelenchus xylophilus]|uniref:(pine wood nematode) hypothetical protein n=1 Tax=Bursaphelenchus xylophilus TaxID=6326 RepID=A0A1I7RTR9_BURXY|nr:unnamed protein product [Bursaphelenchus xylophilus]CAG9122180.1 unnamed protein product [Bursaphelenchus xylophilus]